MPGFTIISQGGFTNTEKWLTSLQGNDIFSDFDEYGQMGVDALASATPVRSGLTAHSWAYRIDQDSYGPLISWYNTNLDDEDVEIAIMIQYGHGTGTGGYVEGRDYINPAIQPVFDQIVADVLSKISPNFI